MWGRSPAAQPREEQVGRVRDDGRERTSEEARRHDRRRPQRARLREAIRGNQRQSEAIRAQRQSEAIRGNQRQSARSRTAAASPPARG